MLRTYTEKTCEILDYGKFRWFYISAIHAASMGLEISRQ